MNISESKLSGFKRIIFLIILIPVVAISCIDVPEPEPEEKNPKAPALTIAVNEFIEYVMNDVYLWYLTVPVIDINYETDSKVYFEKLLNEEDKWSFITDDVKKLEDSFEGIETSFGWSLGFGIFSNTKTIFAVVEYVYPNTPAANAGLKRGDFIFSMNGGDITEANYMDLLNSTSITFSYGQYGDSGISNAKTLNLNALELNLDPVQFTNVIEHGGHKIGYMFYAQFIGNYNSSIDAALQYFLNNQVTDVVLDLRYNPGGTTNAAQHLCSSLAPVNDVIAKKTLVKFQWNDKYQKYWKERNYTDQLGITFIDNVAHKMGLSKLHVITGKGTASASELTITGLKPYMNITTVGDTTYGKYTASITLKPEDFYTNPKDYKDFDNWAIQPIILKYANSQGVTDFKDGFVPDILDEDDVFSPIPLGDKNEALLKRTIEEITGVEIIAMKSASVKREFKIFDRGFSKFDANKRELIFNGIDKSVLK
jgi:C-terminal processing protease CtpA/Prc